MNYAVHVAIAALFNSGLWFVYNLRYAHWTWLPWVTSGWIAILLLHLIYISAIADYSEPGSENTPPTST
jgi:hypothetical protein